MDRGKERRGEWQAKFDRYKAEFPAEAAEFERILASKLPDGWDADVPKKGPEAGAIATRKASQDVIQWAAARSPSWSAARPTSPPRR